MKAKSVSGRSTLQAALALATLLPACVAQREAAEQSQAVELHREQHDSAECANAGLVPGSEEFKACVRAQEAAAAATVPAQATTVVVVPAR